VPTPVEDDPWSQALVRLGYTRQEINRARDVLAADPAMDAASVPDRLRAALRVLSGG
jgi:Holliday junction resolvasome RuvABC DNA-binding subunit